MRYRLRTLLIGMAVLPVVLGFAYSNYLRHQREAAEFDAVCAKLFAEAASRKSIHLKLRDDLIIADENDG